MSVRIDADPAADGTFDQTFYRMAKPLIMIFEVDWPAWILEAFRNHIYLNGIRLEAGFVRPDFLQNGNAIL
jgi:hypothetical protein